MIIVRAPLRVSLGGGGTDLPGYFLKNNGFVISAAINKFITIVHHQSSQNIVAKHSQIETAANITEIKHNIIREVLKCENLKTPRIEISSMADIPAATGLGSSGSFTTALLKAVYTFRRKHINQDDLAELACHIEIDKLGEPIGKQDQYIAAIGGINSYALLLKKLILKKISKIILIKN